MTPQVCAPTSSLPLTLVYVDIEGSTVLVEDLGDEYPTILLTYRNLLRGAVEKYAGNEISLIGDGYFAAFPKPEQALEAALAIQQGLRSSHWPKNKIVRARIGIHTGHVRHFEHSYEGLDVHRVARISGAGNGGQILLSQETVGAIDKSAFAKKVAFRNLGAHWLKNLRYPEVLFDVQPINGEDCTQPLRTFETFPSNLPTPTDALIGREKEEEILRSLFIEAGVRLVTITGPGGVGKTHCALAAAQRMLVNFPAGVFLVELSGVENHQLVAAQMAQSLGLRDRGEGPLESLIHHLRHSAILLLLDNFEQVIEAREVVRSLLARCSRLKILVTSRESLSLPSERILPLSCLACPTAKMTNDLQAVAASPAVQLFVARARQFDPAFALHSRNAAAISNICRVLDGLPLGIELAAARTKILSPQKLLERISSNISTLEGGPERVNRHRTLWETIDWSYRLLNPEEQRLLQTLSVFHGGLLLESAEEVCQGLPGLMENLLNGVSSLLEKSFLCPIQCNGERRLVWLESIRTFAEKKLEEEGSLDEMREKHGWHFIELAESLAPSLLLSEQRLPVNRLLDEQQNLREALAWSLERPDGSAIRRGVQALLWFWISRGLFTEGIGWVEAGLVHVEANGTDYDIACLADAAGWLHIFMGDYAGALLYCRRAHDLCEKVGKPHDIARTKMTLGITLAVTGDEENGPPLMMEALDRYRGLGDQNGTALALIALGEGLRAGGDLPGAEDCYKEALQTLTSLDNVYWPGQLLQNLAHIRLAEGDPVGAGECVMQALTYGRSFDYPMITTLCLSALSGIAQALGHPELAARLLGLTRRKLEEMGAHFEPIDRIAYEHYKELTKNQLGGEGAYHLLEAEGMEWTVTVAIADARSLGCLP